ncbi:MAG TPA: NAD(P)-dependent oxidoreductase [Chloroflexota bacterium]|nr:NAD(P)-dependent oxidoreductase [Chloroflexota bacterium]
MEAAPTTKPKVVVTFTERLRPTYIAQRDWERLARFAEPVFLASEGEQVTEALVKELTEADALIVCHGAPKADEQLLEHAPRLRVVGELEGDRFERRLDVALAEQRGVTVLDTTNGSSYPVSEWALALMMVALRNAGQYFRQLINGERVHAPHDDVGYLHGELTGKRVGLIGCGHIGRRLLTFLKPFDVDVRVYDPYLAPEVPDAYDFKWTDSLEQVFRESEVVVCLAPLTPRSKGMIGAAQLDCLQANAAFVNVSRGAIVDSTALIERLKRGDGARAALDVFDPEPIPIDGPLSEIRHLPNVFLSPHIAGVTAASRPRFFELMVDELERFFAGYRPRYVLGGRSLQNRRGA